MRASGLTYTILRNTLYLDLLPMLIDPGARARGTFYYAVGSGQASFALRAEIAEVLATVLTTPGHANQTYDIAPGPVHTMDEVTAAISAATGQPLCRMSISDEELAVALHQHHLPEPLITLTPTHPLLAVIDLAEYPLAEFPAKSALRHLYLVVLKRHFYGELPYGQRVYDYRQGVLGFYAPGQP